MKGESRREKGEKREEGVENEEAGGGGMDGKRAS